MKFFAAIVLVAAVASATPVDRRRPSAILDHIAGIIAAVKPESVAVGPAVVDAELEPIAIGPAIIESHEPVAVGPAWIDFPLPDGGAAVAPVEPSPVAVIPGPVSSEIASGTPLVQIILNINHASAAASPAVVPTPVHVVESVPEPVHVVEVAPEPVQVVETAPEPVQVVETAPVPAEPVIIGVPILPEAVVALPEELN